MTDAPSDRTSSTQHGTWSEPQADWLPITRAVFRFAITHSDRWQSIKALLQDDLLASGNFIPSIEDVEQFISRRQKADADLVDNETDPLSLYNLTTTLRDKAGVRRAEIDLDKASFRFEFDPPAGGSAVMSYDPCDLSLPVNIHVEILDDALKIHPRLLGGALLNRGNGLVLVSDETATHDAQQFEAIRSATDHVWNQLMLPAFARLVSAGQVKVYARATSRRAQFEQLPADLCFELTVEDWQYGTARDPDGTRYYSLHAADSLPKVSPTQASSSAVESAATKALAAQLMREPDLTRDRASSWCATNGHHLTERGFLNRVWPAARVKAGLQSVASPGRPKKSKH